MVCVIGESAGEEEKVRTMNWSSSGSPRCSWWPGEGSFAAMAVSFSITSGGAPTCKSIKQIKTIGCHAIARLSRRRRRRRESFNQINKNPNF